MSRVYIRPLEKKDAQTSYKWRNDADVWKHTGNRPDIQVTPEIESAWIEDALKRDDEKRFAICIKENDEYIGNIQLTGIDHYEAEFHIFIGEKKYWNTGIGTEATALLIGYAFNELKLQCIYLSVTKDHQAAIQLYKKNGFYELIEEDGNIKMALYATDKNPKMVSVFMMAYNHEKFIVEALEGIIKQARNFDIDIVVGEDCSTDNTRKILLEYAKKYPGLLKLILYKKNIGAGKNQIAVLNACKGKYIAMCEGDDYWTDPYKLQKQVDFLEANPEYAICFSGYKTINEFTNREDIHLPRPQSITIESVIEQNIYSTATVVFLAEYINPIPDWFSKMVFGDWSLYLIVLYTSKKKAYCFDDITAAYRIHSGGVHGNLHASNKKLIKAYKQHIDFYRSIQSNLLKKDFINIVTKCIRERKNIIASLFYKEKNIVGAMLSRFY